MRFKARILRSSITLAVFLTFITSSLTVFGAGFPDLSSSNFAYDAIMQLASRGVVNGYDDGKFYPDNSLKRSEFCKLITTAMDIDVKSYSSKTNPFLDIKDGYWGRDYIFACYDQHLIDGMGDGTFRPENTITYEQAVKIAVCAAGLADETKEISDSKWYSGYLKTAEKNGLLSNTYGVVEKPISRACASQIIYNTFFDIDDAVPSDEPTEEPTEIPTEEPPTYTPKPVATKTPTEIKVSPSQTPSATTVTQTEPPTDESSYNPPSYEFEENLIFIDAGHNFSGADTGARALNLKEEEITWQIANKLKTELEKNGFQVVMSRETLTSSVANGSTNDSLYTRCNMANEANAEIFISVHCNAGGGTGVETYCYSKQSSGYKLASAVQKNVVETAGMVDRKVKTANYVVIRETLMPAILVETGFIDREEDAAILGSENGQSLIAEGIARGVCEYKNVTYVK